MRHSQVTAAPQIEDVRGVVARLRVQRAGRQRRHAERRHHRAPARAPTGWKPAWTIRSLRSPCWPRMQARAWRARRSGGLRSPSPAAGSRRARARAASQRFSAPPSGATEQELMQLLKTLDALAVAHDRGEPERRAALLVRRRGRNGRAAPGPCKPYDRGDGATAAGPAQGEQPPLLRLRARPRSSAAAAPRQLPRCCTTERRLRWNSASWTRRARRWSTPCRRRRGSGEQ